MRLIDSSCGRWDKQVASDIACTSCASMYLTKETLKGRNTKFGSWCADLIPKKPPSFFLFLSMWRLSVPQKSQPGGGGNDSVRCTWAFYL